MTYIIYALAAIGAYRVARFINNEFIKPKPSYSPLFRLWDRQPSVSRPQRGGAA